MSIYLCIYSIAKLLICESTLNTTTKSYTIFATLLNTAASLVGRKKHGTKHSSDLCYPAMAPSNDTAMAPEMPPSNGTRQWHTAMAPSNGTQQWHPAMAHSSGTRQSAMAPRNGTLPWHLTMAPSNGGCPGCHVQFAKVVCRPLSYWK